METNDFTGLLPGEIARRIAPLGAPPYRGSQIFRSVQKGRARCFDEMTDLPAGLRRRLAATFSIGRPAAVRATPPSASGARKILFRFGGGAEAETVVIGRGDGPTVCVSSQAGCRYGCAFCATPLGGFARSLTAGEIAGQLLALDTPVRRIVYMGMGEPLANYRHVVQSIRILTHPDGFALPARRITVSTAGLVPLIDRLAAEKLGVRLAISLTAADDRKRRALMPVAGRYSLAELLPSAARFGRASGETVTFEYVLLAGVNDTEEDARALALRLAPIRCKLNLIPFNRVDGLPFEAPGEAAIDRFLSLLAPRLTVTVRRSAGGKIDAACGQLRLGRTPSPEEKSGR